MNNFLSIQNLIIFILISFISYIFTHPEKIVEINAFIAVIFAPYLKRAEKPAVKLTVESSINKMAKDLNKQLEGLLPYGVEIQWVRNTNRESFINDNNVVIRMEYHTNNIRNIVHATLKYLETGLLNNLKKSVDKNVSLTIDYITAKKALRDNKYYDSVQYLIDDIINPIENENESMKELLTLTNNLYDYGFFTRIFLNELKTLDAKIYVEKMTKNITNEIINFMNKLNEIANKEKGVDIDSDIISENFRISFVYIARYETLQQGFRPYIRYIEGQINRGFEDFYLIARGKYNIEIAKVIANNLDSQNILKKIRESQYSCKYRGRQYDIVTIKMNTIGEEI